MIQSIDDEGFSLVELAVYIVLLGIVTTIVAAVIFTAFRSEQTISATTNIASSSQNFVTAFDRDMRNARSVLVAADSSSLTAEVASSTSPVCWQTVTWSFVGDTIERNGGALIDRGVSGGAFSVDDTDGELAVSDTERTVRYSFNFGLAGAAPQTITGTAEIGPANQTEGLPCS